VSEPVVDKPEAGLSEVGLSEPVTDFESPNVTSERPYVASEVSKATTVVAPEKPAPPDPKRLRLCELGYPDHVIRNMTFEAEVVAWKDQRPYVAPEQPDEKRAPVE